MIRSCLIFFCCLLVTTAAAQVQDVDSLQKTLNLHPQADTVRVDIFNALSYQYQWLDFNQSLNYAEQALKIAEPIHFMRGIATACYRQAHCYWALGDSDRSIEMALRAVSISEQENLIDVLAETFRILAMAYRDQQEIEKAISYIRRAEAIASRQKNWDLLARVYNLAGVIDYTRRLPDSALMYYHKALEITASHPITTFHVSQVLSNIGEVYLEDDPDKALTYFTQALRSAKESRNKSAEAGIMADVGRAFIRKKNYKKAEEYLQQSLAFSRQLGLKRVSRHVYLALVDMKVRQGKAPDAFNYMRAYYDVRDSLINASKTRQIVELETRFEKEKQERRIWLLEQEQRIQQIWRNVLIVGSLLLAVILVIIYRLQTLKSTKTRQLLETQRALNEKLKETDTLKSRFFANISHEFRTPLSLILGPLEEQLLNQKLRSPERKDLLLIHRNANRLLTLVNQILDLSKLEAGKMELSVRRADLAEFIQLLTASFDSLAQQRQITFVKNIPNAETLVGYDADKLEKIVNNVLFNAFKFTSPGGQVALSLYIYQEDHKIVFSVADTGRGIPIDEQSNVFSPFYQLKYDREDGHSGTGLGLSLVNELIKLYGGTITLASERDKGTCITVTLPLLEADIVEQGVAEFKDNRTTSKPEIIVTEDDDQYEESIHGNCDTILIVEDNSDLRNFIASGFRDRFTVLTSSDGEEGLTLAMEHLPDIIISDVMMPRMNGLVFTSRIKQNEKTSHIPVVLLTAKADGPSRIEGLKEGADDYLAKPFSMEELRVRIDNLLEQRRRLAAKFREEVDHQISQAPEPHIPSIDEKFMAKVRLVIEENIGNSHFSVEVLATEMNLSRAQLFRKIKALINTSPSELINDVRLQRAAKLLLARTDNVSQIGYAVGFNEQSYFAKRFRKKYGVSPSEYAQ